MIISCEKCNKKFELSDELVPDEGRLLQCGACSYKWHYIPTKTIKLVNEIDPVKNPKQKSKKIKKKIITKNNEIPKNLIEEEVRILSQGQKEDEIKKNKNVYEEKAKKRIKIGLILNEFGEQNKIKGEENEIQN